MLTNATELLATNPDLLNPEGVKLIAGVVLRHSLSVLVPALQGQPRYWHPLWQTHKPTKPETPRYLEKGPGHSCS